MLGADDDTLQQFCELQKEDIKASTAILNPNIRGSTTLQLSWIWHEVAGHILLGADPEMSPDNAAAILECMLLPCQCEYTDTLLVKRVHWLRARAQKDRWSEECMLVRYEME